MYIHNELCNVEKYINIDIIFYEDQFITDSLTYLYKMYPLFIASGKLEQGFITRSLQVGPVKSGEHVQTLGSVHVPPLRHIGSQMGTHPGVGFPNSVKVATPFSSQIPDVHFSSTSDVDLYPG